MSLEAIMLLSVCTALSILKLGTRTAIIKLSLEIDTKTNDLNIHFNS